MRTTSAGRVRQSLRAALAIGKRDTRAAIYGLGLYVVMFVSLVAGGMVLRNDLSALQATDFVIALNPLKSPLVVYIQVVAIYIAISSAITVARDRDRGTLELLIYGPVDYASYLLGKFLSQITCYAVCVIFGFVSINLFAIITGFVFELDMAILLILSCIMISCICSFGLLLSSISSNVRRAFLLVMGILILFLVVQVGYSALVSFEIQDPASPVLYLRDAVGYMYRFLSIVSPFGPLDRSVAAISMGHVGRSLGSLVVACLYSVFMMTAAIFGLTRRGVR